MEIIDEPQLKSPLRYIIEGSITLALWAIWIYWILPIVNLILWLLGIRLFYYQIFMKGGYEEFIVIMKQGGLIAFIITAIILLWIYYNYLWFLKRGERRTKKITITDEQISNFFNIDAKLLKKMKEKSCIKVLLKTKDILILDDCN
ncbi:MAG TPA: poly-beta-1,6-N-acetyl-D-glucosamine biosynthesis protein PgaD [Candidatus Desulfofervidus auxilii]|uniref:Poly-beta-1,6-N-acetyl-D-glucosamine biosynthesis protein PgaD n=1 Tax=Desulfofervidus auxilii TaxID=1621989 RepID=A0A7C0Y839_DESA2|nr:poly-beta-1,6-N-acetyl-D-glucosamine biosynthesis protein PgaD [Candidatus Desulfofervidus auxilii]